MTGKSRGEQQQNEKEELLEVKELQTFMRVQIHSEEAQTGTGYRKRSESQGQCLSVPH